MAKVPDFPLDTFRERLSYNPETGDLTWLVSPSNNVKVGQVAGVRLAIGYRKIVVNDRQFYAHHVAWFLHCGEWPSVMIDHVNGSRDDNRIANLRLATQAEQNFNTKLSIKNTSGRKGVARCSKTGRWRAYIMLGRKQMFLGNHATFEAAVKAREDAELRVCGQFIRRETSHANDVR